MKKKIIATAIAVSISISAFSQNYSSSYQPPQSVKTIDSLKSSSDGDDLLSENSNLPENPPQQPCSAPTNIIWAKVLGGPGNEEAKDIAATPDGGYIVAGYSSSSGGDVTNNYGAHDFWVVKLDASGNILWQKNYGGSSNDDAYAVDVTPDRGYIVAGGTSSSNHDVTGLHGSTDVWVVKLDSSGSILWSKAYGGSAADQAYDIKSTTDGGYIVAGYTMSTNGDLTGNPSHGSQDYWLLKLSSTGAIQWQHVYGGPYEDFVHSVKQTADGGYIISGYCRSCQNSPQQEDLYMVKVDQNGVFQWDSQYGAWAGDGSSAVAQTSDGGYISTGITHSWQATGTSTCTSDQTNYYHTCAALDSVDGTYIGKQHKVWLLKTNSIGQADNSFDHNGIRCYGGTAGDDGYDVIQTCAGNYLFAGDSKSSDYDVTCNNGNHDFWVGLVNPAGALIWQESLGGSNEEIAYSVIPCSDGNYIVAGSSSSSDGNVGLNRGGLDFWIVKFSVSADTAGKATYYADLDGDGYGTPTSSIKACSPPHGYVSNHTDCNDGNANIHPGATEICNGIDDNCDGQIDEGVKSTFYIDADGDGYGSSASSVQACSAPVGYVSTNTDCDDGNVNVNPGVPEICNGIDDNCNGLIDEGVSFTFYADADGDGFGTAASSVKACSDPAGYVSDNTDCDDGNANVNPAATEICNGIDDNCNGQIDEGVTFTFYADADGDGFGTSASSVKACSAPAGYVSDNTDCDDGNANVNPVATEICNGIDDNCDGEIDEGFVKSTFYADADGDGYGSLTNSLQACFAPAGFITDNTDCDDGNANVNPAATEICNGIDDNCDGEIDEGFVKSTFYADADGDGYGSFNSVQACSAPPGYVSDSTDCDDNNANVNPGAIEICNGVDDNCDGQIDEGFVKSTFYADADGDGYGSLIDSVQACSAPIGYVSDHSDCNDGDVNVHPGATEVCNGIDDNCNGQIDEGGFIFYADADGDGYGTPTSSVQGCSAPPGYVLDNTDCNDGNANVHPGATEICNAIDDNCNGQIDEGVKSTFYVDADGDGYGSSTSSVQGCSVPSGYVLDNTDCNDGNANVHPGATEVCNGIDDNCNGQVDEGVKSTFYADVDKDGYGNPSNSVQACSAPAGYVSNNTDCNDNNAAIHPGVTDVCNSIDDNCNGIVDENAITATITPSGSATFCSGSSITLTANSGSGISYQWLKNAKNISGATKQTYQVTQAASFTVKESNSFSCNSTSVATSVTMISNPSATITAQGNLNICSTGSVTLQANAGTGLTYQWLKNSVTISGATQQNYVATAKGTFTCIVTNSSGCSKTSNSLKVTKSCAKAMESSTSLTQPALSIYPNPSQEKFFINLITEGGNDEVKIIVLNTMGQIIYAEKALMVNGNVQKEIKVPAEAASGLYIVKVIDDDRTFEGKLILQR